MPSVFLSCSQCGVQFPKDIHEISRRRFKTDSLNFFCSRSCTASFRNTRRLSHTLTPQYGNCHSQKYSKENSWYVTRAFKDQRAHVKCSMNRNEYDDLLASLWTGNCSLTGVPIHRKKADGSCETSNPFNIASVDRIDSLLPYQAGNVQWVSQAINYAKNDDRLFVEHFSEFVKHLIDSANQRELERGGD